LECVEGDLRNRIPPPLSLEIDAFDSFSGLVTASVFNSRCMLNSQLKSIRSRFVSGRKSAIWSRGTLFAVGTLFVFAGCEEKERLHPPADMERSMQIRGALEPESDQQTEEDKKAK
jgi:hypothetical protein